MNELPADWRPPMTYRDRSRVIRRADGWYVLLSRGEADAQRAARAIRNRMLARGFRAFARDEHSLGGAAKPRRRRRRTLERRGD